MPWLTPKVVGELQKNKFLFVSLNSIYTDEDKRTIWLDLESNNFNLNTAKGSFIYAVIRKDVGTARDFSFLPLSFSQNSLVSSKSINLLNDEDFWNVFTNPEKNFVYEPISEKINFIQEILHNIKAAKDQNKKIPLSEEILKKLELNEDEINILLKIKDEIKKINKKHINELLYEKRYSLLIGELTLEEEILNKVATEEDNIKKPSITFEEVAKYFEDVIIDDKIKQEVYLGMSLPEIIAGKKPKSGGVILIDRGGTGKSLLKSRFIELFKRMKAEVKEKSQGDITSYVNSGPQVIKKWYRGGPTDQVTGHEEVDLVGAAKKNGIPSLLVIDEAEEFIRENKNSSQRDSVNALNTLKKYIQDAEKGGVTGYVITLLIANMNEKEIHEPLKQGAERLKPIYLGPPSSIEIWEKVIKNVVIEKNKLEFKENQNLKLLAELLLKHNNTVSDEGFVITPRELSAYSSEYYSKHTTEGEIIPGDKAFFKRMFAISNKQDKWKIDFNIFLKDIILEILTDKLNKDTASKSKKEDLIKEYFQLISVARSDEENKSHLLIEGGKLSEEEKLIIDVETAFEFISSNMNKLELSYNTRENNSELLSLFISNLVILNTNLEKYYEFKKIDKKDFKIKEIIANIKFGIKILENWKNRTYTNSSEYTGLARLLHDVLENQK